MDRVHPTDFPLPVIIRTRESSAASLSLGPTGLASPVHASGATTRTSRAVQGQRPSDPVGAATDNVTFGCQVVASGPKVMSTTLVTRVPSVVVPTSTAGAAPESVIVMAFGPPGPPSAISS